jgi:hypothetical protein
MDLMNQPVVVSIFLLDNRCDVTSIVGARNCTSSEFRCVTSGNCIPAVWVCDHDVRIFSFDKYEIFYFSKDDCEDASDEQTEQCREYFVKF